MNYYFQKQLKIPEIREIKHPQKFNVIHVKMQYTYWFLRIRNFFQLTKLTDGPGLS